MAWRKQNWVLNYNFVGTFQIKSCLLDGIQMHEQTYYPHCVYCVQCCGNKNEFIQGRKMSLIILNKKIGFLSMPRYWRDCSEGIPFFNAIVVMVWFVKFCTSECIEALWRFRLENTVSHMDSFRCILWKDIYIYIYSVQDEHRELHPRGIGNSRHGIVFYSGSAVLVGSIGGSYINISTGREQ